MRYFAAILLLYVASCNTSDNNEAGGPCSYDYDTLAAVVVQMPAIDSNQFDIVMALHDKDLRPINDTIRYSQEQHHLITAEEIATQKIQLNDTLLFVKGRMITGSCNPNYSRLLMKR
jgi:hypothetical protein